MRQKLNVSPRSLQHAAVVQEKAAPELVQAVERGDLPVSTAAQLAHLSKDRQRDLATAGKKTAAKSAKRMRIRKASRAHDTRQPDPTPKDTETTATCASSRYLGRDVQSAKAAFLKEQAANGVGTSEADHAV